MTEAEIKAFNAGYMIACCNFVNMHNEPTVGAEVLAQAGMTRADVKAMDLSEYDMLALKEMVRNSRYSPFADKRKAA